MDRERYLKVEGDSSFVRDKESSAIVNVDKGAWKAARERANAAQRSRDEIRTQAREINNLKCEMHEIKDMLQTLLDR